MEVAVRLGELGRSVRRRRRQMLGFTILMVLAVLILVWARYTSGYLRDVCINIGASFVIVAMSYAIFDPIFEEVRRARVQEQPYFDDEAFCKLVARASREVRIMDTANHMLEGSSRLVLLQALTEAAQRRADIRILLLDPDSTAAVQRAGEISPVDVRAAIIDNLRHLRDGRERLAPEVRDRLRVRVYDALPSIQFFQYDDRALVAFFPAGGRASASPHLEIAIDTSLGEFVHGRFDELWDHARTRTLDMWLNLEVSVWYEDRRLSQRQLGYLELDDRLYLDATPIAHLFAANDRSHIQFQLPSPSLPAGLGGYYSFDLVGEASVPPLSALRAEFEEKYGNGSRRMLVELTPARAAD
jgi:hypothetical protein